MLADAAYRVALRAVEDARLQVGSTSPLSREQVRLIGVVGASLQVLRGDEEKYDAYLDRIVEKLKEVIGDDSSHH